MSKDLNYTWLGIAMLFVFLMFLAFGCTTPAPVTERLRSYQVQYQMKFIGNDALTYRNGKLINRQPSGIFTNDTVRTEIKTTTEKY